jgi:hypothetical protein
VKKQCIWLSSNKTLFVETSVGMHLFLWTMTPVLGHGPLHGLSQVAVASGSGQERERIDV